MGATSTTPGCSAGDTWHDKCWLWGRLERSVDEAIVAGLGGISSLTPLLQQASHFFVAAFRCQVHGAGNDRLRKNVRVNDIGGVIIHCRVGTRDGRAGCCRHVTKFLNFY